MNTFRHFIADIGLDRRLLKLATDIVENDEDNGICLACHETSYMPAGRYVNPDATGYECDSCGADAVMGAQEYLVIAS